MLNVKISHFFTYIEVQTLPLFFRYILHYLACSKYVFNKLFLKFLNVKYFHSIFKYAV